MNGKISLILFHIALEMYALYSVPPPTSHVVFGRFMVGPRPKAEQIKNLKSQKMIDFCHTDRVNAAAETTSDMPSTVILANLFERHPISDETPLYEMPLTFVFGGSVWFGIELHSYMFHQL